MGNFFSEAVDNQADQALIEKGLKQIVSRPLERFRTQDATEHAYNFVVKPAVENWSIECFRALVHTAVQEGMRYDAIMEIRVAGVSSRVQLLHPDHVVRDWPMWADEINQVFDLVMTQRPNHEATSFLESFWSRCKMYEEDSLKIIFELTGKVLHFENLAHSAQRYALKFHSDYFLRCMEEHSFYQPRFNHKWSVFECGNARAVDLLASEGNIAEVDLENGRKATPLCTCWSRAVAHRLLSLGADPRKTLLSYETAHPFLLRWIMDFDPKFRSQLIKQGADYFLSPFAVRSGFILDSVELMQDLHLQPSKKRMDELQRAKQQGPLLAALFTFGFVADPGHCINPCFYRWTPQTNRFHSTEIRDQVRCALLVMKRMSPMLPKNLRLLILSQSFAPSERRDVFNNHVF